jgi:gas vesicle protein
MENQTSLHRIIEVVFGNDVTFGFSAAIVLIFALAVISHMGRTSDKGVLARTAPTILTSIGVLGTFLGIFLGLLDFDVNRIDKSVPTLLSGLKVAFATSILGMFFAIIFKLFQSLSPKKEQSSNIGADEIHKVLIEMRDGESFALEQIRKAISDESDSSLVTQMQKLRASLGDGQGELKEAITGGFNNLGVQFADFAETMAENNTKALVDALESVIRDFNTQLNEQFGDNFKQLNEAVAALLTWQEQYKDQVQEMGDQFNRSLEGIQNAESTLSAIATSTASIPHEMEQLGEVMTKLDAQIEDMNQHLEAFAHLKEEASTAFPLIEEKLNSVTNGIADTVSKFTGEMEENLDSISNGIESSVSRFTEAMEENLDAQEQSVAGLKHGFDGLKDQTDEAVTQVSEAVETALQEMTGNLRENLEQQSHVMQGVVGQMHEGFKKAIEDSNEVLGKQIAELDQQMQDEVRRVVEVMGGHLASLSNKFVDDYTPLTDKLRDVLRIAEAA